MDSKSEERRLVQLVVNFLKVEQNRSQQVTREVCDKRDPSSKPSSSPNRSVSPEFSISLKRMSAALTNVVYRVEIRPRSDISSASRSDPPARVVLLRLYGAGAAGFVDRAREIATFRLLGGLGLGPRLLHEFGQGEGRFEEWLVGFEPISVESMRSEPTSKLIAKAMARFHRARVPREKSSLAPRIRNSLAMLVSVSGRIRSASARADVKSLESEAPRFLSWLSRSAPASPVVFGHNDVQYNNVLRSCTKTHPRLALIDFEYAAHVERGFDIGNHWCEWAADYHSSTPHVMDFASKFPTEAQQRAFCLWYLEAEAAAAASDSKRGGGDSCAIAPEQVERLRAEANTYAIASHLYWAIWGFVQSVTRDGEADAADFDYQGYAYQRLAAFRGASQGRWAARLTEETDRAACGGASVAGATL